MKNKEGSDVRVRFAPSPTGFLHVGGLRTAFFNYLFAKKNNGKFILRVEDTDRKRYVPDALENLISTLQAIGFTYDEGPKIGGPFAPYIQSERTEIYEKYAKKLLESENAYYCFCSEECLEKLRKDRRKRKLFLMYDGKCRNLSKKEIEEKLEQKVPYVIRLKFPKEGKTVFYDKVREKVEVENKLVEDQILIKADGFPTYHLANVVDDHLMKISHVIRGEEWLSSTPKHLFLYQAFGWKVPKFVHLPLLLNPDKSKLSKRQGDVAVEIYLEKGYLPEALLNFVALLGWHAADNREIYSLEELGNLFSLNRITKSGAVFDLEKLNWMNSHYLRNLDLEIIAERAKPFFERAEFDISKKEKFLKVVSMGRKRISNLSEIITQAEMFYGVLNFSKEEKEIIYEEKSQMIYSFWFEEISKFQNLSDEKIGNLIKKTSEKFSVKGKDLYFPIRLALYGKCHGPDLPIIIDILGKNEIINRFKNLISNKKNEEK